MQKYFPVFDSLKPGRTHRLVFLKSLFTFLLILDIIFARVVAFARRCLDDSQFKSRKQHHTAKRIYDQLVAERGFSGGETTVPMAAKTPQRNSVSRKAQDGPRRGYFFRRGLSFIVLVQWFPQYIRISSATLVWWTGKKKRHPIYRTEIPRSLLVFPGEICYYGKQRRPLFCFRQPTRFPRPCPSSRAFLFWKEPCDFL